MVQKRNYRDLASFFQLALDLGVTGVAVAAPDMAPGSFHTALPSPHECSCVLLDAEEIKEYTLIVDEVERRFAPQLARGFLVEGDLRRFIAYLAYYAGLAAAPPLRECVIPGNRLIIDASGGVHLCFFHGPVANIQNDERMSSLMAAGGAASAVREMTADRSSTCRGCCQFLNWSF